VGGYDPKLVWCHTNGVGDVCCMVKGGSTQSAPSSPNKCRPRAGRIGGVGGGDGSTPLSVRSQSLLPAASTSAAHGLARSGVSGVLGVTLAVQAGCAIRPTTSEECAYGRHSPSDAFERVRRVEVLGLATDGCWI
jgi:hypothetical protein